MASRLHLVDSSAAPAAVNVDFDAPALCFGPFALHRARKLLLEGDRPLRLSSRAFEILSALVERPGVVVSKDTLIARAWPGTVVEEINLRVHIAALRKLLGDAQGGTRYITNVSGRGYCFVAPVVRSTAKLHVAAAPMSRPGTVGRAIWPMIGRQTEMEALKRLLDQRQLVTIVGPGGIGKTTLAARVTQALEAEHTDGAFFVDLASSRDPAEVASAIATAFGVTISRTDPVAGLAGFAKSRELLLCLDNCEHVVDAVAALVEGLLAQCPSLRILATSREAIRAEGEQRYHLGSLTAPPLGTSLTADEVMRFAAAQLFVDRAAASLGEFTLVDADAVAVARLCHRLGGIPLAIELAAARIDQFGVQGLLDRLDDRLLLQAPGRRTALPRHRTLRGMLDWSHDLLEPTQRAVLYRLSVFRGSFTLADALSVVAQSQLETSEAAAALVALAEKSLLSMERHGEQVRYRMLDVTRAYAAERLALLSDADHWHRRHAEHLVARMTQADGHWAAFGRERWLASYADAIDDLRGAWRWALASRDDVLAARIAAGAAPLAFQLGLLGECRSWAEQALAMGGAASDTVAAMRLLVALGHLEVQTGIHAKPVLAWFERANALASQSPELRGDGLAGLFVASFGAADYPAAAQRADSLAEYAQAAHDGHIELHARRMQAQAAHYLGGHEAARAHAESLLDLPMPGLAMASNSPLQIDRRVSMLIVLARIDWLQGRTVDATHRVETCLALARSDSPFALCQALALAAIPLAWWMGDFARAEFGIVELNEQATRYASMHWTHWAAHFAHHLGTTVASPQASPVQPATLKQRDLLATLDPASVDDALVARVQAGLVGWNAAEVLRVDAIRRAQRRDLPGALEAVRLALERARRQGELAWELRASVTACQLGAPDARSQLGRLLDKCHHLGMTGPDVRQGKDLFRSPGPSTLATPL